MIVKVTGGAEVHITDRDGKVLYNRLWDDGSALLRFASGFGHIDRSRVRHNGWVIVAGWLEVKP